MRVFITGVSSGIGKSLVHQLVKNDHEVWGVARREPLLTELARRLSDAKFRYSVCDVSNETAVLDVVREMKAVGYHPDVVILNAAVDIEEPFPTLSAEVLRKTIRTNLEGALVWVSHFLNFCLNHKHCQFIAVSSLFAHWPDTSSVSYAASKAGLEMAFRGLRMRYSDSEIQFKLIHLGPVDTEINPRFAEQPGARPPPWVADPDDVARFILKNTDSNKSVFYFPWYVLILLRCFGWLPDRLFELVTRGFKR